MAALPGRARPSTSAIAAIVEAVPITMQCPLERERQPSTSAITSSVISPARRWAQILRASVPEPSSWLHHTPFSMGPPVTMIAGTSAEAAPISIAGVVLSQAASSTTESIG
jgi:hypothetical protein